MTAEQLTEANDLQAEIAVFEEGINILYKLLAKRHKSSFRDRMVSGFGVSFDVAEVADIIQILIDRESAALNKARAEFESLCQDTSTPFFTPKTELTCGITGHDSLVGGGRIIITRNDNLTPRDQFEAYRINQLTECTNARVANGGAVPAEWIDELMDLLYRRQEVDKGSILDGCSTSTMGEGSKV